MSCELKKNTNKQKTKRKNKINNKIKKSTRNKKQKRTIRTLPTQNGQINITT